MNCLTSFRGLRLRHVAAIAVLPLAVGLPFLWVQYLLFGPADRLLSWVTSHFQITPDALTAVLMVFWCLLLGAALFAGSRFLRRRTEAAG